jgi:hypothetical protein
MVPENGAWAEFVAKTPKSHFYGSLNACQGGALLQILMHRPLPNLAGYGGKIGDS